MGGEGDFLWDSPGFPASDSALCGCVCVCVCARTQLLLLPTHAWAGTAGTRQACFSRLRGWVELGE